MTKKKLHIKIVGTKTLLINAAGAWIIPLEKQERTGVAGNDPEEWKQSVLADKVGRLYFRNDYAFSCMKNGAKSVGSRMSGLAGKIASTLEVSPEKIFFDRKLPDGLNSLTEDSNEPVYLDVRIVRREKAANVRYRVAVKAGWRAEFDVEFDPTLVQQSQVEACIIEGGRYQGLGDGRKIGFGRFDVESAEEI
jgi:hypothetical protein